MGYGKEKERKIENNGIIQRERKRERERERKEEILTTK